jgi:hypothetical protein
MKPLSIYLDTNAFRYFGIAFENVSLAPEITEKFSCVRSVSIDTDGVD